MLFRSIGHSLDAQVELAANSEWYSFLAPMEGDLANLFITSKVVLKEGQEAEEGYYTSEDFPGLAVKVSKAPGVKCERCWIYSETTGQSEEHPTLCKRCADVLK